MIDMCVDVDLAVAEFYKPGLSNVDRAQLASEVAAVAREKQHESLRLLACSREPK